MDYLDQLELDSIVDRHDTYSPESSGGERGPRFITCRYCGLNNLIWKKTPEGYRTASIQGVIHRCPAFED